ncbi:PAS domain S-box protein [Aliirhizobium smilacinae]|uniref:histidine kinase n=2 Tax=Aliirhizobium smilacinae TaxID=1395944 RepID=A0A5C4XDD2_9HYPH|nr:PAS domain-containing sensor histidine kinase [Rhizobium smilacinae]TNM61388.1 PAS domain S-box protein [Rhizobium smilacinae]
MHAMMESHDGSLLDQERYRLLVDAISDYAIYMLDPSGHVASWNAGAQRFKGYEPEEILGHHFSRFYSNEDRRARLPEKALETAMNEGRFESEGWRIRKDGTRFWAHVILDPIWDRSGHLLGFAKVTRDLTERKKAEAELRLSEEKFQLLVNGVSDYALYMLDPDGFVSNWNAGAARIKGYTAEEAVGRHFSHFYTEEDQKKGEPERNLEIARRIGRVEREGLRQRKDGTTFWAHVVIDAIRGETGQLIGYAKITRDISEKVEAQKALTKTREELFQAQKMEAIGQLTGGIAHDFNNLLMAIMGSLEILRKRMPDDPALRPLLDNALQGTERGAALTQRMLAFSRRQELNMRPVNVPLLVAGMMDFLERSLRSSMRIETHFPPDLPNVLTDSVQLETALLNLVVNARDAMGESGTVTISAERHYVEDEGGKLRCGDYLRIYVSDTGEGMDPETVTRATTPFFTTKGVGKGTGLGLSMVQGLTEQSGGMLSIESVRHEGTTVSLFLPTIDEEDCPKENAQAAGNGEKLGDRPLIVLAVDDDALVLMNTTLMLEDLGHQVIEAYSGSEALAALRQEDNRIDLVITDHSMPKMTGAELAAEIATEWPGLPVVLATGYAELPDGSGNHLPRLPKPFSQQQLSDMIGTVTGT